MSRRLILHIGTTKTGSTSIQNALHAARAKLAGQGVYYADTANDVRHTLLAAAFASTPVAMTPRNQIWQGRDPLHVISAYLQSFKAEMEGLPPEIGLVVLSAEQFSHWIRDAADIKRLHEVLVPHFDEIKVVLYLRRQDSHYASNHAQMIRLGRIAAPDMTQLSPFWHDYNYAEVIARWAAGFGESALLPRLFERGPGKPFDVVTDFFQLCGIVDHQEWREAASELNTSMDVTGQHILRRVEALLKKQYSEDAELRNGLPWQRIARIVSKALPGRGWQPTRTQAAAFMARFAASNELVRQRWFVERASLFCEDFSHLPEHAPNVDFEADFNGACKVIVEAVLDAVRQQQMFAKGESARAAKAKQTSRERIALSRVVKLDSTDIEARLKLARLQIDEGALSTARHHVDMVLKSHPDNPLARRLMKRLHRAVAASAK
jgi:hypothetical protein